MLQKKPPLQDVIARSTPKRGRPVKEEQENISSRPSLSEENTQHDDFHILQKKEMKGGDEEYSIKDSSDTTSFNRGTSYSPAHKKKGIFLIIALIAGLGVLASTFVFSLLFSGASLIVYPKNDTVVVNTTFIAEKNGTSDTVPFRLHTIEKTEMLAVESQSEEEVEERAKGIITVYNNFSETPVRLIKNTRFQSENGNIYRIPESLEVPGMSGNTMGKIEVEVFAEGAGENYNLQEGKLSVPGFVDLPQEGKVYGEIKTPLTGGFIGKKSIVTEEDRIRTLATLEEELKKALLEEVKRNGGVEGEVYFEEGIFYEFIPLADEMGGSQEVKIALLGKMHIISFDEKRLAEMLAKNTIAEYDGLPLSLGEKSELRIEVEPVFGDSEDEETLSPLWNAERYSVSISGKAVVIWEYNQDQFVRDIAGKPVSILQNDSMENDGVLSAYGGIDRIDIEIRPFWKKTLPEDINDIVITTKLD
jgi:hypothetical protein